MSKQLSDHEQQEKAKKKKRKRCIIWFNPLFSKNVKTNVGKIVLNLVKKHFAKGHIFHKIFNKNTVKVSYLCMLNIGIIISGHNKAILNPKPKSYGCNCLINQECPLDNKCLTPFLIYKAEVTNNINDERKIYIGAAETPFKERFRNHKRDMCHRKYLNSTELSK